MSERKRGDGGRVTGARSHVAFRDMQPFDTESTQLLSRCLSGPMLTLLRSISVPRVADRTMRRRLAHEVEVQIQDR
jgi:hypothetical protein